MTSWSGSGLRLLEVVDVVGGEQVGLGAVDAHIVGEVALQVGIDDQHAVAELGEDAADVEAEHRFADAALEGPEGDDLSMRQPP